MATLRVRTASLKAERPFGLNPQEGRCAVELLHTRTLTRPAIPAPHPRSHAQPPPADANRLGCTARPLAAPSGRPAAGRHRRRLPPHLGCCADAPVHRQRPFDQSGTIVGIAGIPALLSQVVERPHA